MTTTTRSAHARSGWAATTTRRTAPAWLGRIATTTRRTAPAWLGRIATTTRRTAPACVGAAALLASLGACSHGSPSPMPPTAPPTAAGVAPPPPPASAPGQTPAAPPSASSAAATPVSPRATDHFPTAKGDLALVPLEHASVLFQWNGAAIYVDPTASAVADPTLPKADIIFLTDIHPDHLDAAGLDRVRKPGTRVVGPQAVADKTHVDVVMHNGDTTQVGDLVATAVPMYNIKRGPAPGQLYHDKGRGNGYEIDFRGLRVYVSGDTECTPEMRGLEKIDVALVCMNLPYTMPPSEAAACVAAFKPKVLIPYHYRGQDLSVLDHDLAGTGVEVRKREWYPSH